jgi:hypothetical protein
MGKKDLARIGETQADNVSSGPQEDRGCSTGAVGEDQEAGKIGGS